MFRYFFSLTIITFNFSDLSFATDISSSTTSPQGKSLEIQFPSKKPILFPHTTGKATTSGPWKINAYTMPGMYFMDLPGLSSAALSAVTIGVTERGELGVVPAMYFEDQISGERFNLVAKLNLYKSDSFALAIGDTLMYSHATVLGHSAVFNFHFPMIAANWKISDSWALGGLLTSSYFYGAMDALTFDTSYHREIRFDISRQISNSIWITSGLTYLFIVNNGTTPGAGATVTWWRPGKFFSAPSLGIHHFQEAKRGAMTTMLFSTSFF